MQEHINKIREALSTVILTDTGTGEYLEDLCQEAMDSLDQIELFYKSQGLRLLKEEEEGVTK